MGEQLLAKAVKYCPHAEILWLMAVKDAWIAQNDVNKARSILRGAFQANANSEEIWLAAVKLEWENNETERARALLTKAREASRINQEKATKGDHGKAPARVYMKSILLEREVGDTVAEKRLIDEALDLFPSANPKLHMMAGQFYEAQANVAEDSRIDNKNRK